DLRGRQGPFDGPGLFDCGTDARQEGGAGDILPGQRLLLRPAQTPHVEQVAVDRVTVRGMVSCATSGWPGKSMAPVVERRKEGLGRCAPSPDATTVIGRPCHAC